MGGKEQVSTNSAPLLGLPVSYSPKLSTPSSVTRRIASRLWRARLLIAVIVGIGIFIVLHGRPHYHHHPQHPPPPPFGAIDDEMFEKIYQDSGPSVELKPRPPPLPFRRPQDQHGRLPPLPGVHNLEAVQIQDSIYVENKGKDKDLEIQPPLREQQPDGRPPRPLPLQETGPPQPNSGPAADRPKVAAGALGEGPIAFAPMPAPAPSAKPPWATFKENWQPPTFEKAHSIPKVQFKFPKETAGEKAEREKRREAVKESFLWSWNHYKKFAWGHDEALPVTGGSRDPYNAWGASIADALGTLLIMGLESEYHLAREHIRRIDFTDHLGFHIPLFETVIRYLGGLVSAFDLSGDELMLYRAQELANKMVERAFTTQTGIPPTRISLRGDPPKPGLPTGAVILAEVGSFTLEFTRLAQITKNETYFHSVHRIMDFLETALPEVYWNGGLLPTNFDVDSARPWSSGMYSMGGQADSYYEYLIKQHLLTQGQLPIYERLYTKAVDTAHKYLLKDVYLPEGGKVLGLIKPSFYAKLEHLTCFAGGMLAMGAKVLDRPQDLQAGIEFSRTCAYAYEASPCGIAPEIASMALKENPDERFESAYDDEGNFIRRQERIIRGTSGVQDPKYVLRPETVESMFYLYRITGDKIWQDKAWSIYQSISNGTRTEFGHSALINVLENPPIWSNGQESFLFAEVFKYLYLIFSEPEHISLDDYVFNTEAHPFLLPYSKAKVGQFWRGDKTVGDVEKIGKGTPIQRKRREPVAPAPAPSRVAFTEDHTPRHDGQGHDT